MFLLTFLIYTNFLDLFCILDLLVQYIDHVIGLFIRGLAMSLLAVGDEVSLEHAKGAYLVLL